MHMVVVLLTECRHLLAKKVHTKDVCSMSSVEMSLSSDVLSMKVIVFQTVNWFFVF